MPDILDELKKLESIATSPSFDWEEGQPLPYDASNNLISADDLFYPGEGDIENAWDGESAKSPGGTTYGLIIDNTGVATETVQLFGYQGKSYFDGRPGTLSITAQTGYGSYLFMLEFLKANPFEVVGIRVSSTQAQIDALAYSWDKFTVWGKRDSNTISASTFRTEKDYLAGIITLPVRHLIDMSTYVSMPILASTTVNVVWFIGTRREIGQAVEKAKTSPVLPGKAGRVPIIARPTPKPSPARPGGGA